MKAVLFASIVADLRLPPAFYLASHRFKASLNPVDTHSFSVSIRLKLFVCLARAGVNTPG
jgi:hypothetical protein